MVDPLLERLGVVTEVVKRGARADLFSATRRFDDGERDVVERELEAFYRTFVGVVARGRKKPVEEIEPLAQGRVYSGADAHAHGLVDELGGFEQALDALRARIGEGGRGLEARVVRPPRSVPDPPALPAPAAAMLEALGLGGALEAAQTRAGRARGSRAGVRAGGVHRGDGHAVPVGARRLDDRAPSRDHPFHDDDPRPSVSL